MGTSADPADGTSSFGETQSVLPSGFYELRPYESGAHSLAEALRSLELILSDKGDAFTLKDIVLRTHHGLETLFKDILFGINPALVLESKRTVADIVEHQRQAWLFNDERTIKPLEALERLKLLNVFDALDAQRMASLTENFRKLDRLRNRIQHFSVGVSVDFVLAVVGNLLPAAIKLLDNFYKSMRTWQSWDSEDGLYVGQPLTRMAARDHMGTNDLFAALEELFPGARKVLSETEVSFDLLVGAARRAMRGAAIPEIPIAFTLRDHGRVGAPPYMPMVNLVGWMVAELEPHAWRHDARAVTGYEAQLEISEPEVSSVGTAANFVEKHCKMTIVASGTFEADASAGVIQVKQLEEHVRFLGHLSCSFSLDLTLEGNCMLDTHHFSIQSVDSLAGTFELGMESPMFGDDDKSRPVRLSQVTLLDSSNTSVRMHAFVESNGRLSDNHSVDLSVDGSADLVRGTRLDE